MSVTLMLLTLGGAIGSFLGWKIRGRWDRFRRID